MNQNLIDYIKKSKEQGTSDEQIKKALFDTGWKEGDIKEGFKGVGTKSNKKILTIGIIILAIIIIVGGFWYFIFREKSVQPEEQNLNQQNQSAINDELKGWETYKSDKYGFEIKYLPKFVVLSTRESSELTKEEREGILGMMGVEDLINIRADLGRLSKEEIAGLMSSDIQLTIKKGTIEDIANGIKKSNLLAQTVEIRNEIFGGDYKGLAVYENDYKISRSEPLTRFVSHLIQGKDYSYILRYNGDPDKNRSIVTTSQIVNSFRLLEQ